MRLPWRRRRAAPRPVETVNPPGEAERLLKRLEFTVIRRLDGLRQGEHRNAAYGAGLDLAELREYQPGDDVRTLDWNVTARMATPYVRRYHEDREITAWLLLDLSASSDYGSARQTKRELIVDLAATLARLLTARGDRVGALLYTGEDGAAPGRSSRGAAGTRTTGIRASGASGPAKRTSEQWWSPHARSQVERPPATLVPAGGGRVHTLQLLQRTLDATRKVRKPGATGAVHAPVHTDLERALEQAFRTATQRSAVFVLSDFLDSGSGWERALGPLARRHEVVTIWVRDPTEITLPDAGVVTFEDAETGEQLAVDTSQPAVRQAYARLAGERQAHMERACGQAGATLWTLSTAAPLVPALVLLLDQRRRTAVGLERLAAYAG